MLKKSDLRPYQDRTVTAFYERAEVQAVLPMGGGKTVAALTAIQELIAAGEIRCAIVLAPKKVAQLVWPNEINEWAHLKDLRVKLVSGGPEARAKALREHADVYVLGVDNTQWLVEILAKLPPDHSLFDCLVIDEMSRFKNPRSKRARALMKVRRNFKNVWGLTGTPRPNGYEDQFGPMKILTNGRLWGKSFDPWREKRFTATDYHRRNWVIRPEWEARTIADINKVTITIGDDEMPQLPELSTIVHWVQLPPSARKAYNEMERDLFSRLDAGRGIAAANMAVATGKLAQMANGFLYDDGNEDVEHLHTEKADLLVELLEDLEENALIAYEFVEDLRRLRSLYEGLPWLGAGVSDYETASYEKEWNRGDIPRLAIHPASAGHGLNLQRGGSHMFWYGMTWSAELYDQTIKRFHRPGQTKRCFNHLILAKDTIDEVKHARVVHKMDAQDAFRRYLERV